jgi:hypothetical protein
LSPGMGLCGLCVRRDGTARSRDTAIIRAARRTLN